jgi:Fe2+ transport system protein FeoA
MPPVSPGFHQLVPCHNHPDNLPCRAVKKTPPPGEVVEGQCAGPAVCPLSRVAAGTIVCVKQLVLAPEVRDRLRELGLGEEQQVKLVSRQSSIICQVCNARVALSEELAEAILVEPVPPPSPNR